MRANVQFLLLLGAAGLAFGNRGGATPPPPGAPAAAADSEWPAIDEGFIRQYAATYRFRLGEPQEATIAPGGDVFFTRTAPESFVADVYVRRAASGQVERLLDAAALLGGGAGELSAEEKARRERMRHATRGVVGLELSRDGRTLLAPDAERLFVVAATGGKPVALATGDGFPYDPQLAPAGDRVAFVRDDDLWVVDARAGATPRRLTSRAAPTEQNGVAEFVAQEEMGRRRGYWWSPDGTRLVFQHNDLAPVDELWVADAAHPERAPTPFRYPLAGRPNAVVTLGIVPVAGGATTPVEWDRARWPYLTRVHWPERGPLTLVVMNRAQTELAVLAADDRGATRTLLVEHDPAWLNLPDESLPRWLDDGSGFLWASERSGFWQLELRAADGTLRKTLTPAEFGMQRFAGFDGARGVAWVVASPDPTESQLWRVPLAGAPSPVTTAPGVHAATVARRGGWAVTTSDLAGGERRIEVRRPDGGVAGELPAVAEAPPWTPRVEWTTVAAGGHELHAAIVRPRALSPGRRYPVLVHVYAGPTVRMVERSARAYLLDQWFADAGFVVVLVDGRGTPNRGRDWERTTFRDLITIPLADQVAALAALGATRPELDLSRVGIFGWSFGGYASLMAILERPELFRAAVAGAPVTDWSLYDTFYTERYMQTPATNPDGYARTSALARAADLTRPLLLIHGTTDDNVHFENTLRFVQSLFRAGKPFELLPVAATHMTPDPAVALSLATRELTFLRTHLCATCDPAAPPAPPTPDSP